MQLSELVKNSPRAWFFKNEFKFTSKIHGPRFYGSEIFFQNCFPLAALSKWHWNTFKLLVIKLSSVGSPATKYSSSVQLEGFTPDSSVPSLP